MDGTVSEAAAAAADAGEPAAIPEPLWPSDRRPGAFEEAEEDGSGGGARRTCAGVWGDLRLMHRVAMARRRKRFQAGALALNKVRWVRPPALHLSL